MSVAPASTHAVRKLTRTVTTMGQTPRVAIRSSSTRASRTHARPKTLGVYQTEPMTRVDSVASRTAQMLMSGIIAGLRSGPGRGRGASGAVDSSEAPAASARVPRTGEQQRAVVVLTTGVSAAD